MLSQYVRCCDVVCNHRPRSMLLNFQISHSYCQMRNAQWIQRGMWIQSWVLQSGLFTLLILHANSWNLHTIDVKRYFQYFLNKKYIMNEAFIMSLSECVVIFLYLYELQLVLLIIFHSWKLSIIITFWKVHFASLHFYK